MLKSANASNEQPRPKLYLLDGMALVYRAHFAFISRPILTSAGFNTSAIFGFLNTVTELLNKNEPTHLAIAFDTAAPTARHEEYAEYKATRDEMPEDLSAAIPHIFEFAEALNIPLIKIDGYEADDIIGTYARLADEQGFETYMVTPDKDFAQLVSDTTSIYKPGRQGDDAEIIRLNDVIDKWQIEHPDQFIDILGLMGDTSDNIPGVPGIGPKTAMKLVAKYGSLEKLLESTSDLKGKQRENIETYSDQARLSKRLATIDREVPVPLKLDELIRRDIDKEAVRELCARFEFNTLGRRLLGDDDFSAGRSAARQQAATTVGETSQFDFGNNAELVAAKSPAEGGIKQIGDVPHEYEVATTKKARTALIKQLGKLKSFCFDLETTSLDAKSCEVVGLAFCWKAHTGTFVPVPSGEEGRSIVAEFQKVFENPKIEKVGHNLKYDITVLRWHDITVAGPIFDTMLAHYCIELDQRHQLDFISEVYLGYQPISITTLIGEKKSEQISMREVPLEALTEYAVEDADVAWQLREKLEPLLETKGQKEVFYEIECPLVSALVEMEFEGVGLDPSVLSHFSKELESDIEKLRTTIFDEAGTDFNLNSPRQLGDVLFDKLNIKPTPKRTRTGQYSTDEQTLTRLAPANDIIGHILEYREAVKLKNTYVDTLPQQVFEPTGRIHTTFNQAVTATGRLNSHDPNLQNIPIRTEQGREIRRAFVARQGEDWELLSADYSQIELRIIAALSKDESMLAAFRDGVDIHAQTAAKVYGVEMDEVSREQRGKAKMVNFGIIYGISAFGLAQRLNIPRGEAGHIIGAYLQQYPGVKAYMDDTIAACRKNGYVETITGRRRYLRDINSSNKATSSAAERNAINSPIQGSAADMIKIAMRDIHREFAKRQFRSRMILQVHDELVLDLYKPEASEVMPIVESCMAHAIPRLDVPIVVEMGRGQNWLEAH